MKIVKGDTYSYERERRLDITFSDVLLSDVEKMAKLHSENADVYVGKAMKVEIPKIPRDGGIELTRALEKANSVLEFVDASKIKGTSGLRPIVIDASVIKGGTIIPQPKRIIRSGEYTTVLWKDGTKTIVKRMPGSEDSDYSAFTAALAKKVYGTNSNVERIVSMTERVKTKAEKKAEKKAKKLREKYVKSETTEPEKVWYRVRKNAEIAHIFPNGVVPWENHEESALVEATSEEEARKKAIELFVETNDIYFVADDGKAFVSNDFSATNHAGFDERWGIWMNTGFFLHTYLFANSEEEAVQLAKEIPREWGDLNGSQI